MTPTRPAHRLLALLVATTLWLSTLHLVLARAPDTVAAELARRQLALWGERGALERRNLRHSNPEWELMRRSFDVLAFANLALARPAERAALLTTIDGVLADTLATDAQNDPLHYLLPYARAGRFRDPGGRSLFVDGQIALMLAARQLVEPSPRWQAAAEERVVRLVGQLERGPILAGESYPDEAWSFCNVVALHAIRLHDGATGQDHRELARRWVASARAHLVDPATGLLVSSFTWAGRIQDGPEGSTLWLVAPFLQLIDPAFAEDQYRRARRELARLTLGFAWAREWPASWPGADDIDSGPTVPVVGANAGSSGLALVAARAFGDEELVRGLLASLELGGFPVVEGGERRYAAGNDLADAVLLYALVQGPLVELARARTVTP